jgi:hypothetical protein
MLVRLYTAAGGFVVAAELPDFNEYPQVIFWGTRVFWRPEENWLDANRVARYTEAFACSILPEQERPV